MDRNPLNDSDYADAGIERQRDDLKDLVVEAQRLLEAMRENSLQDKDWRSVEEMLNY